MKSEVREFVSEFKNEIPKIESNPIVIEIILSDDSIDGRKPETPGFMQEVLPDPKKIEEKQAQNEFREQRSINRPRPTRNRGGPGRRPPARRRPVPKPVKKNALFGNEEEEDQTPEENNSESRAEEIETQEVSEENDTHQHEIIPEKPFNKNENIPNIEKAELKREEVFEQNLTEEVEETKTKPMINQVQSSHKNYPIQPQKRNNLPEQDLELIQSGFYFDKQYIKSVPSIISQDFKESFHSASSNFSGQADSYDRCLLDILSSQVSPLQAHLTEIVEVQWQALLEEENQRFESANELEDWETMLRCFASSKNYIKDFLWGNLDTIDSERMNVTNLHYFYLMIVTKQLKETLDACSDCLNLFWHQLLQTCLQKVVNWRNVEEALDGIVPELLVDQGVLNIVITQYPLLIGNIKIKEFIIEELKREKATQIWVAVEFGMNSLKESYSLDLEDREGKLEPDLQRVLESYFQICLSIIKFSIKKQFFVVTEKYFRFLQYYRHLAPNITANPDFRVSFRKLREDYERGINPASDQKGDSEKVEEIGKKVLGFMKGWVDKIADNTSQSNVEQDASCKYDSGGEMTYDKELGRWLINGQVPKDEEPELPETHQENVEAKPPPIIKRGPPNRAPPGLRNRNGRGGGRGRPVRRFVSFINKD